MSEQRHTASTITDDVLDHLYERLARSRKTVHLWQRWNARTVARLHDAEAALARVRRVADLIEAGAPWTANHQATAARIRAALDTGQPKESTTP